MTDLNKAPDPKELVPLMLTREEIEEFRSFLQELKTSREILKREYEIKKALMMKALETRSKH